MMFRGPHWWVRQEADWLNSKTTPTNDDRRAANRALTRWRKMVRYMKESEEYNQKYLDDPDDHLRGLDEERRADAMQRHKERIAESVRSRAIYEEAIELVVARRAAWGKRSPEQRLEEQQRKIRRRKLKTELDAARDAFYKAQRALQLEDDEHVNRCPFTWGQEA